MVFFAQDDLNAKIPMVDGHQIHQTTRPISDLNGQINWSKEVKPHLKFSHRLDVKTYMFVLSKLFIELRCLHIIVSEEAVCFFTIYVRFHSY